MPTFGAKEINHLLSKGNLAQAEIHLRLALEAQPDNPVILNFLGWVASAVNQPDFAVHYFTQAARLAPDWQVPQTHLRQAQAQLQRNEQSMANPAGDASGHPVTLRDNPAEKFLLIKSWGCGFCADVSHVLGQLLLAELTGRTPVVHWGSNCLFGDGTGGDAFEFYFEPLSDVGVQDLQRADFSFWPPKWNHRNLKEGEINQKTGPYSRVAGLYLLGRPEKVIVADYYTGVVDLMPWIPVRHRLYGLSIDNLYRQLVRQYLRPTKEILREVDEFFQARLATHDFLSAHVRGSDKVAEMGAILDQINNQYKTIIDRCLAANSCNRVFLMTDDARMHAHFLTMYGDRIVTTHCQRTHSDQGIHYQVVSDRRRLGTEMLVDTYLAARAKAFVGNGFSNPSLFVGYLRDRSQQETHLLGNNLHHTLNTFIHDW